MTQKNKAKNKNLIPGLMFEHISSQDEDEEIEKETANRKNKLGARNKKNKNIMLWVFTFFISASIFAVWFLNINSLFFDFKRKEGDEDKLLGNAKAEFAEIMTDFTKTIDENKKKMEQKSEETTKIENILSESLLAMATASSTATTTMEIATTTEQNQR